MTIFEFLELSAGNWFTHRTSHYVSSNEQNSQKSNLAVELLDSSHADVMQLCQSHQLNADAVYAAHVSWETIPELSGKKQTGADLLLFVPDAENPANGAVYRKQSFPNAHPGRYALNGEDRLTLITPGENLEVEEHLWFESPNVRIRHSVIHQNGIASLISFASEIRRVVAPLPPAG